MKTITISEENWERLTKLKLKLKLKTIDSVISYVFGNLKEVKVKK